VSRPRAFPVVVAGFSAFLDLYATQPLLPFLARTFHASNFAVSLTVTAPTLAVALAAPAVGRLADRVGLRRTIVLSSFALALATALGATAGSLEQLIFWRFAQGLVSPGIFSIAIAYIHEEWPAAKAGSATAAYVGGTVVGGFTGRALTGVLTSAVSWQSSFAMLSVLNFAAAAIIWWRLPEERRRVKVADGSAARMFATHVRNRLLLATYVAGFCILCSQIAMFTYVTFHLAAPPFGLSTAALGWIFATYLLGAAVTPVAGLWIDRFGLRAAFIVAVVVGIGAAALTLAPSLTLILAGLALFGTSVFVTQAVASSHVAVNAAEGRGFAIGLYATCYYVGGSVGSAVPALMWGAGGWPACVAFVVAVQLVMLSIAGLLW